MNTFRFVSIALAFLLCTCSPTANNRGDTTLAWVKAGQRDCFRLVFSPNGDYFLSTNSRGAQVWSTRSSQLAKLVVNPLGYGSDPYVFSQDGKELFYADSSRIICWSIERDSLLFTFLGHHNIVRSLSLSPDGSSLLSAGDDSLVVEWDVAHNPGMRKNYHLKESTWKAAFVGNGKYIAVEMRSGISIIDRESDNTLHRFSNNKHSISSLGNVIAISEGQQEKEKVTPGIGLYDLGGKKIMSLRFPERVWEFEVTSDGKFLVACSGGQFLKVFDATNGSLLRTISGPFWSPMTISQNGKFIAAAWGDSGLGLWDLENGSLISHLPALSAGKIFRIAISEDGLHAVLSTYQGKLCLVDTKDAARINTLTAHTSAVETIVSNGPSGLSLSLSGDGKVQAWQTTSGENVYSLELYDGMQIRQVAISHNGKLVATVASRTVYDPNSPRGNYHTDDVKVSAWEAGSGEWIRDYPSDPEEWYYGFGFTLDDQGLLVSRGDSIQTYDVSTGKLIRERRLGIFGSLSPRSGYFVTHSFQSNADIAVWNLSTDTLEFVRAAHAGFTRTLSISDDETILVSSGQEDQVAKVWQMAEGKLRNMFKMNVPEVHSSCVSPSARFFVAGSITGVISIWELESGKLLQSSNEYPGYVNSVGWSPDEKLVFAGFSDGTIIAIRNHQLK
jgi:WD40 repeat protein